MKTKCKQIVTGKVLRSSDQNVYAQCGITLTF